jgi:hypothetical protein
MGMSTHACGYRNADEKWNQMKAVWNACEKAGVSIPDDVYNFFDGESPDDKVGMEVELGESCKEWCDDYREGYEIDLTKIPKDVSFIRVYNSY